MSPLERADGDLSRALALGGVLVALGAPLQVMYRFIDIVGLPVRFLAVVVASLLAATALARVLRPRVAAAVGAASLVVGLGWYLTQLPADPSWVALVTDALSLLRGRTLLHIANVRAWVLGVTPAPVFLTWYFAVRRSYAGAVVVAGGTLGFFVLTGDANVVTTLTGVVAAGAALALGDIDRRGESIARAEPILVVAALMIVVPSVVTVVPTAAGTSVPVGGGPSQSAGLETNLLEGGEDVSIQGRIQLSPHVRFTVTSDEGEYWRVGSYDRYTGDGWVRTGGSQPYVGGPVKRPPGPSESLEQQVRVENESEVIPAAWKPVRLSGLDDVEVRGDGSFVPGERLERGETYTVRSRVPDPDPRQLRNASTDYPDAIESAYTQLPDSTSEGVSRRTARLTADAESPYETARTVERWLQQNKNYSLNVERPRGNVAEQFLFEMDAGYCTYFATTMVAMLRSQDVPARFVTGYSTGERVSADQYVVRGLNAHAWVEVYFPDYGWVRFDPTPSGPRTNVSERRVEAARANDVEDVDVDESRLDGASTPTSTPGRVATPPSLNGSASGPLDTPTVPGAGTTAGGDEVEDDPTFTTFAADGDGDLLPRAPTRQELALGLVALVGTVFGVRRSGLGKRAYRAAWLRYQPRADPAADVERAFQRLLYYLGRRSNRSRRPDETVREYLDAVDAGPDARRVASIRERARYRGAVSEADADEAVRLVNELVR